MSDDYDDTAGVLRDMAIMPQVIRNSAICLVCEQEIESEHAHVFRTGRCGNLSVDGGHGYTRRIYKREGSWKNQVSTDGVTRTA